MLPQPLIVLLLAVSTLHRSDDGDVASLVTRRFVAPVRVEALGASGDERPPSSSAFLSCNAAPDGDGPHELAFLADGSAVVIAHKTSNALTFWDVNARVATDTVAVGNLPVQVATTPDGRYALAPCVFSSQVAVVDVATRTLAASIPISGQQPYKVLVTPDSQFAVVGVIDDATNSHFSVLDLATLTEIATIPSGPQGVIGFWFSPESGRSGYFFTPWALSPDGTTIVLPDAAGGRVRLYDRISGALTANLAVAANPEGVDVSADGQLAVVTHQFGTKVLTKIDLSTRTVSGSFVTANDFSDQLVRITPDKSHAIAAISNNVVFVNLATGATAATLFTGSVGDIELSFDGQYAFVSNFNSSVIDLATRTIVKSLTLAPAAEAVTSPVALRAVALNSRFKEDVQVYDIHGAAGFVEGFAPSGPPPEGDASRSIAVSQDGKLAVVGNDLSRNVCVVDLLTSSVRSWIPTGDRVLGVGISPDSSTAVVCNGDSDTVSVIDLATDTVVATLSTPSRPVDVRISPDSQTAYVNTVAGTDAIYFLHLAGAASSVIGSIPAGQMGSANGYAYTGTSGIGLSPDGSVLVACASFDDQLQLIDTATRTQIVRVNVGDFPYQVAFNPSGTRAYVINSFGDSVSVVNMAGAASSTIATVSGIDFPATVDVDATGSFVYVTNDGTSPAVRVISAASNTVVATLPIPGATVRSAHLSAIENVLYCAASTSSGGEIVRVNAAGASSSILEFAPLSSAPAEMGFSEQLREVVAAQPIIDGVDLVRYVPSSIYCAGAPNSVGPGARMSFSGTTSVAINDFTLEVDGSPPMKSGYFYYGTTSAMVPFGDGFRCAGGTIGRLRPATLANGAGHNHRLVNFTVPPASTGATKISPGQTKYFSYWYRDPGGPGGSGSNLADGLSVTFAP